MLVSVALYDRGMIGQGFTFDLPEERDMHEVLGLWVRVPFGSKDALGVIVGPGDQLLEGTTVHAVWAVESHPLDFRLPALSCSLMLWMSAYYLSPLHRVLRLFVPLALWEGTFQPKRLVEVVPRVSSGAIPRQKKQVTKLLTYLEQEGVRPKHAVLEQVSSGVLRAAVDAGYVEVEERGLLPVHRPSGPTTQPKILSVEQRAILNEMEAHYPETSLLYGVTGAGKTEMYVHIAERMREKGKQTALLVPEIALTPQLLTYFQNVFGERLAVLHSRLSEGEKCQEWLRIAAGDVDVVIGSRSALFAPYRTLGQIILDEEHEWTYKNEQNPRYLTHTVAEQMATIAKGEIGVLFASGTPALERFARARGDVPEAQPLRLYTLDRRIYEQTFI
ncbi:hypothetical protein COW46_02045 [Candidatus Gracilibacteria bacterium CG17_big_fil_post_rev_8_21_14_2_50_48_13]|nr:MAG: hypothetical protein COW46_02045 [Candidatus Gracilibacteria bacterium CG17_big_fil_post_rev_8_21_14_2_50_48_13]